jgi:phage-related protein
MSHLRTVAWLGSSRANLSAFPEEVREAIGFALYVAQQGGKHFSAKPLRGFSGAGVVEIVDNFRGDTYRAVYTVYTVRFSGRIYVLHVFQKKSKTGNQTPKAEIDLIRSRIKRAEQDHEVWQRRQKESPGNG